MKGTKTSLKNARRKLETPKAAAVPYKRAISQASIRETVVSKTEKAKVSEAKTRFSCIAEAHESTRQRIEPVTQRIHEEHITGKGQNSVLHHNLVHKFIPKPQAMKIPDAKAAVDKEWKKLETILAWDVKKSEAKRGHKRGTEKQQSSLCFIDGFMSCKEFGVGATTSEVQRKSCAPRKHCERRPQK